MKIHIESLYGDKSLSNDKNYTLEEIKQMYNNILCIYDRKNAPEEIAKMYEFKIVNYDFRLKYNYDYYIDMDIDLVSYT